MNNFESVDYTAFVSKVGFLKKYIKHNKGFIAGGVFKNIFLKEKIRDIDIFFKCEEDFKKAESKYNKNNNFKKIYGNDNCVAFYEKSTKITVELVKSQFYPVEEMISKFDFTIVKFALHKIENEDNVEYRLLYHPQFFEHLLNRRLVIDDGMVNSVATFNRVLKYCGYGYGLCHGSKIKLIEEIILNGNVENMSSQLYFGFD
jgi:hypothetical protein